MPTTLTGLLLLIVILLPGITYVAIRERKTPEQRRSAFRETATVATVSIAANAAALGVFALVRARWPDATPDIGKTIKNTETYLQNNYAEVALWAVGILAGAIVIAAVAARIAGLRRPHPSVMSSWWLLFDDWLRHNIKELGRDDIYVRAACYLTDGSTIEGTVEDFNRLTDETPDRDLILVAPITRQSANGQPVEELPTHAACISARDIRTMLVYYRSPPEEPSELVPDPPDEEGET